MDRPKTYPMSRDIDDRRLQGPLRKKLGQEWEEVKFNTRSPQRVAAAVRKGVSNAQRTLGMEDQATTRDQKAFLRKRQDDRIRRQQAEMRDTASWQSSKYEKPQAPLRLKRYEMLAPIKRKEKLNDKQFRRYKRI